MKCRGCLTVMIFVALVVAALGFSGSGEAAKMTVTWTDNSTNEDGFNLERKVGTGTYTALTQVAKDLKTYVDLNVTEGVTYCYRLNAYNTAGVSAWSNEACAMPPFTIPAVPGQVEAIPGQ